MASGTLVHDGQADVGSNNGGAKGDALLMSAFGLTNGNLTSRSRVALRILGTFTDRQHGFATISNLSTLWLIGTLTGNPPPACLTVWACSAEIDVGSRLTPAEWRQAECPLRDPDRRNSSARTPCGDGPNNPSNSGNRPDTSGHSAVLLERASSPIHPRQNGQPWFWCRRRAFGAVRRR